MIIFTDENIPPHLAPGFQLIQAPESMKTGIPLEVKHLPDHFGYGSKDVVWIPELGKLNACIITRDTKLSRRKHEIELLKAQKLGVFFLKPKSKKLGLIVWEMVEILACSWPKITKLAVEEDRPFGYDVFTNGKLRRVF